MAGIAFCFFIAAPFAALLGYWLGIHGKDLALLPLATFLGGATTIGLLDALIGGSLYAMRVRVIRSDGSATAAPPTLGQTLRGRNRTELKLDNWKRT